MSSSTKILTVTYGTFSCTLEGFDDPFTTLQKVAEYFRKLAAEDRYFGAVPQLPDIDTVKRIAEQNAPHGVEAEANGDGVIIRPVAGAPDDALPAPEDAEPAEEPAVPAERAETDAEADDRTRIAFTSKRSLRAPIDQALKDIRETVESSVEANDADEAAEDEGAEAEDATEAALERVTAAAAAETQPQEIPGVATAEAVPGTEAGDDEAAPAVAGAGAGTEPPAAAEMSGETAEDGEADRAVIVEAVEDEAAGEDEQAPAPREAHAEEAAEDTAPDAAEAAVATAPAESEEPADRVAAEAAGDGAEQGSGTGEERSDQTGGPEDAVARIAAAIAGAAARTATAEVEAPQEDDADEAPAAEAESASPAAEAAAPEAPADARPAAEATVAAGVETAIEAVETEAPEGEAPEAEAVETGVKTEPLAEEAPGTEAVEAAPAEAAAADAAADTEAGDAGDAAGADFVVPAPSGSSLTPEEEEELARELREAESIVAEDTPPDPEAEARRAARRERARALRESIAIPQAEDGAASAEMDRLLDSTRKRMDHPEQKRRFDALEQLKAAVAATEAERKLAERGPRPPSDEEDALAAADLAAYREDLRRAGVESLRKPRPRSPESAPLILVSEQMVKPSARPVAAPVGATARDGSQLGTDGSLALQPMPETELDSPPASGPADAAAAGSGAEDDDIPADAFEKGIDFETFVERIGAFDLIDLLEASAAHTVIVEGITHFSRAQVMAKLAALNTHGAYSKEAGLRAFGKLLREGIILRVQDGQFTISKSSRLAMAALQRAEAD